MNRRVVHRYALWLLPLLAVRALIPTGFMLSVGLHGLELTFCPVQSSALVQALAKDGELSRAAHLRHSSSPDAGDQQGHAKHHEGAQEIPLACPYAVAATAAVGEIPPLPAVTFGPVDEPVEYLSRPFGGGELRRADRIRGPPLYS